MTQKQHTKFYVGCKVGGSRELIRYHKQPTAITHGHQYLAVIGPFRTKRGAEFMRDYGQGNPHCQCVRDAERLAVHALANKTVQRILGN